MCAGIHVRFQISHILFWYIGTVPLCSRTKRDRELDTGLNLKKLVFVQWFTNSPQLDSGDLQEIFNDSGEQTQLDSPEFTCVFFFEGQGAAPQSHTQHLFGNSWWTHRPVNTGCVRNGLFIVQHNIVAICFHHVSCFLSILIFPRQYPEGYDFHDAWINGWNQRQRLRKTLAMCKQFRVWWRQDKWSLGGRFQRPHYKLPGSYHNCSLIIVI